MKFTCALLMIFGAICGTALAAGKPNIVILLVDDLGHSDVGFTGSKDAPTPNIDRLAKGGTVLDSFDGQPFCSPTRAARGQAQPELR